MDSIKQLIVVIQVMAGAAGMFRIAYIIVMNLHEEDKNPIYKKCRNVIIAVLLIELILFIATVVKRYYGV